MKNNGPKIYSKKGSSKMSGNNRYCPNCGTLKIDNCCPACDVATKAEGDYSEGEEQAIYPEQALYEEQNQICPIQQPERNYGCLKGCLSAIVILLVLGLVASGVFFFVVNRVMDGSLQELFL